MDPLSIAASIVGLCVAAVQVNSLLKSFIDTSKSAPASARHVLTEVTGIYVCLNQVEAFLSGRRQSPSSRKSLVMIEKVIIVFTDCVSLFSELEQILESVKTGGSMRVIDRVKWASKEKAILRLLARLQASKTSLTMIFGILTCASMEDAETTTRSLNAAVQQLLKSNMNMSRRLKNIERMHPALNLSACPSFTMSICERDASRLRDRSQSSEPAFEKELETSPVYKRTAFNRLRASRDSSNATSGPSFLSGLSLSDVSNATAMALPIALTELWNHHRYTTAFDPETKAEGTSLDAWYYPPAKKSAFIRTAYFDGQYTNQYAQARFNGHLIYRRFSVTGPDRSPRFKEGWKIGSGSEGKQLSPGKKDGCGERAELEDTSPLKMEYQQAASTESGHSKASEPSLSTNGTPSLKDSANRRTLDSAVIPTHLAPLLMSNTNGLHQNASPPTTSKPPVKAFHRSPSSNSVTSSERTVTPVLNKRSSYSSLQETSATSPRSPRSPLVRRVSSNVSLNPPNMGPRPSLPAPAEEAERPPVTAASVARDYFRRELEVHQEGSGADGSHKTVVILQDDCYAHRYSRPRTSRASLGTIVERPERIHASILGLATAYVRLGGRHVDGHFAPHPKRNPGLLTSMPFRVQKTNRRVALSSQAAAATHGAQWMDELKAMCEAAESKLAMNGKELSRPQATEYGNEKFSSERPKLHEGDLYLCSGSLDALEGSIGGVCEGVDAVFRDGGPRRAFVCIRPPGHHCSADMPSGFCWVNNVHIGINYATKTHDLTHAAIIDFDLHHGDGSQSIAWAHNAKVASMPKNTPQAKRTAIGYFSLHDINSYPCEGGDEDKVRSASLCLENAHGQTIWNVHLQPWKTDEEFWELYQTRYTAILSKARSFLRSHTERLKQAPLHPRPKAAIFLSAGFDASEWESPGMQRHQVNVPTDFYARFTRDVVAIADEEGLGVDGRVISVLEGGYSDRALVSGVLSHLSGLTAGEASTTTPSTSNGLAQDMSQRMSKLEINGHARHGSGSIRQYSNEPADPGWWSFSCLEEIEKLVHPPAPAVAPKKSRNAVPPTYSSATQSYTAKIISPPQNRRSLSGSITPHAPSVTSSPRAPSPPPPPVEWATAAHELSKLLVPSDRQTLSCKPEDLNAEATRARRDRQSNIGIPIEKPVLDSKKMQLRDRKAKPPKDASDEEHERSMSRANRRRTIADVTTLVHEADQLPPFPAAAESKKVVKPRARRSSMASSVGSVNGGRSSPLDYASSTVTPSAQDLGIVKKNRVPTSTRAEAAKAHAPKSKAPVPVPPIPTVYRATSKPSQDAVSHIATSEPLAENGDLKNRDVDQLASGMKKMSIKLNVPSKAEQKIREAKRGPTAPRGRPKTTATKAAQTASGAQERTKETNSTAANLSGVAKKEGKVRIEDLLSYDEPTKKPGTSIVAGNGLTPPEPQDLPVPEQNPTIPSDLSATAPPPPPPSFLPTTAPTIPATADPPDTSVPIPPSEPNPHRLPVSPPSEHQPLPPPPPSQLPLLPSSSPAQPAPTTSTSTFTSMSPARRTMKQQQNLPIFSSTSSIPFGRPNPHDEKNMGQGGLSAPQMGEKDISGYSSGQIPTVNTHAHHHHPPQQSFLSSDAGGGDDRKKDGEETKHDIFDVPDSPHWGKFAGGS
ncbi:MAG: hypothetical protein Q9216_006556 [Gyalolechia sp. 2 TL-2023]